MFNLISFAQSLGDAAAKSEEAQSTHAEHGPLDRIAKLVSIIANVAVIVVAVLAYGQYRAANDDLKRSRSLEFVGEWTDKGYSAAYSQLSSFVEDRRQRGETFPAELSPDAIAVAKYNLGQKWSTELGALGDDKSKALASDLDTIVQFFSRMSTCASSKLCDEPVLAEYFDSELLTFWDYFSAYAQVRRENGYVGYGSKVDFLVADFRKHGR